MDSYQNMLATVQAFHDKHRFRETGGEELAYRVALMTEELGEISACVTKGKSKEQLAEECADLVHPDSRHGDRRGFRPPAGVLGQDEKGARTASRA